MKIFKQTSETGHEHEEGSWQHFVFGSWLVYALLIFVTADVEWTTAEKFGIGAALYGVSWITFVGGSILLGPDFIERLN